MKFVYGKDFRAAPREGTWSFALPAVILTVLNSALAIYAFRDTLEDLDFNFPYWMIIVLLAVQAGIAYPMLLKFVQGRRDFPRKEFGQKFPIDPQNPTYLTTCSKCGTVYDYQKSDVTDQFIPKEKIISCPCCEHSDPHSEDNIVNFESDQH